MTECNEGPLVQTPKGKDRTEIVHPGDLRKTDNTPRIPHKQLWTCSRPGNPQDLQKDPKEAPLSLDPQLLRLKKTCKTFPNGYFNMKMRLTQDLQNRSLEYFTNATPSMKIKTAFYKRIIMSSI